MGRTTEFSSAMYVLESKHLPLSFSFKYTNLSFEDWFSTIIKTTIFNRFFNFASKKIRIRKENIRFSRAVWSFSRICERTIRVADLKASCMIRIYGITAFRYLNLRAHYNFNRPISVLDLVS